MSYPTEQIAREHREQLWSSMLQYYHGVVPIENVENQLRGLMGDAALHIHNDFKELDLDKVRTEIGNIRIVTEGCAERSEASTC